MSIVIQVLAATGGGFNLIVLAMALERTTALAIEPSSTSVWLRSRRSHR